MNMRITQMFRRRFAVLCALWCTLCMAAALLLLTPAAASAATPAGSFTLYASVSSQTLIEPVQVSYTEGQTVEDALKNSGYSFGGFDQGYITEIEGTAGNFVRYYDGGGYDLQQQASAITGILITEREDVKAGDLALVKTMSSYRTMTNHVQNYPPAAEAYADALTGLRTSGFDGAAQNEVLLEAIADYEKYLKGTKYKVTVSATQAGKSLTSPHLTMTDLYGNVTEAQGTTISVVAGTYEFCVSDGGLNCTEGTLTVRGAASLKVTLPSACWFRGLHLLDSSKAAYEESVDLTAGTATFYLPDTAGRLDVIANVFMEDATVPDEEETKLYAAYYNRYKREDTVKKLSWDSTSDSLVGLVLNDCQDADFLVYAQYIGDDGYAQKQTVRCRVRKVPTFSSIQLNAEGTKLPLNYAPRTTEYDITTVSDSLKTAAIPYSDDYKVTGTGEFTLKSGATTGTVTLKVTGTNGNTNTYRLKVTKVDSVPVTVNAPSGCSVKVYNAADALIAAVDGVYHLIPDAEYYYVTTKKTEYHARESFKASRNLAVTAKAPEVVNALTEMVIYDDLNAKSRKAMTVEPAFASTTHDYTYTPMDALSAAYAQATCADGYKATAYYNNQSSNIATYGTAREIEITNAVNATGTAKNLQFLLAKCGYTQTAKIRVAKTTGTVTYYQDYRLSFCRSLHLSTLTCSDVNGALPLYDPAGTTKDFNRSDTEYYVSVDRSTESISISGTFMNEASTTPTCGGYYAIIGGVKYDSLREVSLPLDESLDEELIDIQVCHVSEGSIPTTYTIHVKKTDPVAVTFRTNPADANVYVINKATDRHISKVDGVYPLTPGVDYSVTITRNGYVGQVIDSLIGPAKATTIPVNLEQARENTSLPDYEAFWPSFRADDYNNGVVDVRTPILAEEAVLNWATQLGEGYSSDACGCPIIVDGYLYTYAATHIYKVDSVSGEVAAVGDMDHKSSFAINSPTYAEGMIFIGLADGTVQAFNAATLESVWIYRDPLKGQPNCPIAYHDGYIYTGFWLGERSPANFVCLSVTDEDPGRPDEEKQATWRYCHNGYYWAGAYVCDNYVLIGTDDGDSGYLTGHASILSLDPLTGDLIDSFTLKESGDQRSSISFVPDSEGSMSGYGYFTTKGGYFYRIRVNADGTFSANGVKSLKLYNYASDPNNPPMSTCTPTIYNGRAYIGISGTAQFGAYSGHNIAVIDLDNWTIAYTVRTQGYPQTSGLLTTAYEEETGDVMVYFFDNYTPGKLRMLRDHKGQTKPNVTVPETYVEKGVEKTYDTAYVLFTPYGDQAQYAICSPLVDEYGTIYFKNDSAYLMSLSSMITKLEITEAPNKLSYKEGEVFDGEGMQVTLTYVNGMTRDVTKYVTWSEEPLTTDDTEFTVEFPYTMYHDENGVPGVPVEHPCTSLSLSVSKREAGEPVFRWKKVSGEGETPARTAQAVFDDNGTEIVMDAAVTSSVEKAATCSEAGSIVFTASVKRNGRTWTSTRTDAIPTTGHTMIAAAAQAPDCTREGREAGEQCSVCGYRTGGVIPALGHRWDAGQITLEATEETVGQRLYTCTVCGQTREEEIPVLEPAVHVHTVEEVPLVPATFKAAGKKAGTHCSECGETLSGCKKIYQAGEITLSATAYTYNGKAKKPTVQIAQVKSGTVKYLKADTDYTLSYKNNKAIGTATVTITLKGNYSGKKTVKYTINPAGTSLSKLTAASRAFTATWKKQATETTGYELRYSTSSKMKSAKTVTISSAKTVSKKITGLSAKKKYYVQVRTYKTVSKTKYYSDWSKTLTVTTK